MSQQQQESKWRNRVVGNDVVPAADLLALMNPLNWRVHSEDQKQTMESILDEIGWVQDVIINRTTNHVLDGHMRIAKAAEFGESVPVKYVELTEAEERKVLATFDTVSAMADADSKMLELLVSDVETNSIMVRDMLDHAVHNAKANDGTDETEEATEQPGDIPASLALQPFEHHDYIVLLFDNRLDFSSACDQFGIQKVASPIKQGRFKIGLGRVISWKTAKQFLKGHGDAGSNS